LLPAAAMLVGAVSLLEINYRLSTQPEAGSRMKIFGVAIDTGTPAPWLAAAFLLVGGYFAFRRTWPAVAAAWQRAGTEATPNPSAPLR
jgi:hypothetical protein